MRSCFTVIFLALTLSIAQGIMLLSSLTPITTLVTIYPKEIVPWLTRQLSHPTSSFDS